MKKILSFLLCVALLCTTLFALSSCGDKDIKIAIPNDPTNCARALLLLEAQGLIELDDEAGITATVRDITSNPYNIKFVEMEAAQIPRALVDVDYAVINSNYAIEADLNPVEDSIAIEGSAAAYANILCVREGNENDPKILALKAALASEQVKNFIIEKYDGAVVPVVENTTDGYDASIDYEALADADTKITVAASPTPHAEILEIAKEILATKGITLVIEVYNDYIVPNQIVDQEQKDANYFQHVPYLDDFNAQNGTHIVSVLAVHNEPMGIYSNEYDSFDAIKNNANK